MYGGEHLGQLLEEPVLKLMHQVGIVIKRCMSIVCLRGWVLHQTIPTIFCLWGNPDVFLPTPNPAALGMKSVMHCVPVLCALTRWMSLVSCEELCDFSVETGVF